MNSQVKNLCVIVGVAVVATFAVSFWIGLSKTSGLVTGQQAPLQLEATGWLNGEPPSEDELREKVVVVHAWFYN